MRRRSPASDLSGLERGGNAVNLFSPRGSGIAPGPANKTKRIIAHRYVRAESRRTGAGPDAPAFADRGPRTPGPRHNRDTLSLSRLWSQRGFRSVALL